MKRKRIAGLIALTAALTLCMPVTASAHHGGGHHGCGSRTRTAAAAATSYCPVEDCSVAGIHEHNGVSYYAHCAGDGHDYHAYCSVEGCQLTAIHEHDGHCYVGCQNADGTCAAGHAYHCGY